MAVNNVAKLNKEKVFTQEQELSDRINSLVSEYNGELSLVSVMGVLALKIIELRENQG